MDQTTLSIKEQNNLNSNLNKEDFKIRQSLIQNCIIHKDMPCDLLKIQQDHQNNQQLICLRCFYEQNLSLGDIIPLWTQESSNGIKHSIEELIINEDEFVESIKKFFLSLREQLDNSVNIAMSKAKMKLTQLIHCSSQLQTFYKHINQSFDLADFSGNLFVQDKHTQTTLKDLKDISDNYERLRRQLSLNSAEDQVELIVENIINLDLFSGESHKGIKYLLEDMKFLSSQTYQNSDECLIIERLKNKQLQITNNSTSLLFHQGALDLIFDPSVKYIVRVHLEQNDQDDQPSFSIGLVPKLAANEELKHVSTYGMCYEEVGQGFGIDVVTKGNPLHSGSSMRNLKKSLEIRVCIGQRILEVSDYPENNSSVEIDDKGKINPEGSYQLHIAIAGVHNKVKIMHIFSVLEFNSS